MEKRNEQLEVLEDVHELLSDALKLVANEPSVGLYFVQQHVHKAVPILLHVKDQITEATAGADLSTADAKDSLSCLKSMKDCGPPVIERMIKTLQAASNQIPMARQSRGSFSQLLPRPARPPGQGKGPLRSSSFLGDWRSGTSTNKGWESFQRERPLMEMGNKKGPGEKPALPVPDSKRADLSQKSVNDAGCDSSDAAISNEPSAAYLKEVSTSEPPHSMLSLLGSAISKAGSVSREGVKLITKDVESQFVGDARVAALKNWISGQGLLGFSREEESMPENRESQVLLPTENIMSSEDLMKIRDNFEEFQSERAAKLEVWLSEPDGDIQPERAAKLEAWLSEPDGNVQPT